jgi:hypothetical protein
MLTFRRCRARFFPLSKSAPHCTGLASIKEHSPGSEFERHLRKRSHEAESAPVSGSGACLGSLPGAARVERTHKTTSGHTLRRRSAGTWTTTCHRQFFPSTRVFPALSVEKPPHRNSGAEWQISPGKDLSPPRSDGGGDDAVVGQDEEDVAAPVATRYAHSSPVVLLLAECLDALLPTETPFVPTTRTLFLTNNERGLPRFC